VTGLVLRGDELLLAHEQGALRIAHDGQHAPVTACPRQAAALCEGPQATVGRAGSQRGGCASGTSRRAACSNRKWQLDEAVQCLAWTTAGEQLYAAAPGSGSVLMLRPARPACAFWCACQGLGPGERAGAGCAGRRLDRAARRLGAWCACRPTARSIAWSGCRLPCPTDVGDRRRAA
jgi:hypothetical protein